MEIRCASLLWYFKHSFPIPPVDVEIRGVKVPCSMSKTLLEYRRFFSFSMIIMIIMIIVIIIIERFSYDLEMFMCEQNANNRLNKHTQTRAGFDWSCEHAMFSSELKVIF